MRHHIHVTETALPPELLLDTIADVARWPEWDHSLEWVRQDAPATPGSVFILKPKGGPRVRLRVLEPGRPGRFVDEALLPLGRLRTVHAFTPVAGRTRVALELSVSGPLAALWGRLLLRGQAESAAAQTAAFLTYAARHQGSACALRSSSRHQDSAP